MASDDITAIDVHSGVNEKGEAFVTIVITTEDKKFLMGQVNPKELREIALQFLEAAEAAETDSIVYRLLRDKFGLDIEVVAGFVADMRDLREY
jgi:hypothetical protein